MKAFLVLAVLALVAVSAFAQQCYNVNSGALDFCKGITYWQTASDYSLAAATSAADAVAKARFEADKAWVTPAADSQCEWRMKKNACFIAFRPCEVKDGKTVTPSWMCYSQCDRVRDVCQTTTSSQNSTLNYYCISGTDCFTDSASTATISAAVVAVAALVALFM